MTTGSPKRPRRILAATAVTVLVAAVLSMPLVAQESYLRSLTPDAVASLIASTRPDAPAVLTVANRPITQLRAFVLNRTAAERAAAARNIIDAVTADGSEPAVTSSLLGAAMVISVGNRDVFAIVPLDVDDLLGETIESKTAVTVERLRVAVSEISEARRPRMMVRSVVESLLMTIVFALVVMALWRANHWADLAAGSTERQLSRLTVGDEIVRQTRLLQWVGRATNVLLVLAGAGAGYIWLTFVLRRFPYTRPWGESLRALLLERLTILAQGTLAALPDFFTIAIIIVIARFVVRVVQLVFDAVESERITMAWVYPETAATTRKLVTALLWLFALVLAYPYLPGSQTDAFKGVSVFVGLIVSLGSSGLVNQVMSGFTLTYSRALRRGDYVKVGDNEGTVFHMGTLSTKMVTPRREEITIPNAVLVSQEVTNFTRRAAEGVYTPTQVTIGYDASWRKVHALLQDAARHTEGILPEPRPIVIQTALEDSYVRYTLHVCLEDQARRAVILTVLHANILDAFNTAGIQIMSPNYEGDPDAPKLVPKEEW
jgi:small-conductance mechanosensitive channel